VIRNGGRLGRANVSLSELYREQASYCAYLLRRQMDPNRRYLLEREREDWLILADRHRLWSELNAGREPKTAVTIDTQDP
jgi:hypothetical protein